MNFHYCILPGGNKSEFEELDEELALREVNADISNLKSGGRIYRIPDADLSKLPQDEKGPYLGDDNSGHSIYKIAEADYYRDECGGSEWITLNKLSQETDDVSQEN